MKIYTVTVAVLTRNEEKTIGRIVSECFKYADEILVVDGHSVDQTRELAESAGALVHLDNGAGKGAGIRRALELSSSDITVFIDADGSHYPSDIPKLVNPIKEGVADLVIGSRMRGGSDELHGDLGKFVRMLGSDIITLTINYRFGSDITDSLNGFRAIRTLVGRNLGLTSDSFTIEHEMLMKTLKNGYRVQEVACHERPRAFGHSNIDVLREAPGFIRVLLENLI